MWTPIYIKNVKNIAFIVLLCHVDGNVSFLRTFGNFHHTGPSHIPGTVHFNVSGKRSFTPKLSFDHRLLASSTRTARSDGAICLKWQRFLLLPWRRLIRILTVTATVESFSSFSPVPFFNCQKCTLHFSMTVSFSSQINFLFTNMLHIRRYVGLKNCDITHKN